LKKQKIKNNSPIPVQKKLLKCISNETSETGILFQDKNLYIMKTAEEIWGAYMQSNQAQNDDWKNLLAEDVSFSGPAAQVKGKDDYIKTTEDFFQMVRGFELKRYVANENLLATEVEIKVATPSGKEITLDMTEFYETKDGKIQSVKVHYDAEEFRKEFGMS
jgi:ketosteroid isomerase-like protein